MAGRKPRRKYGQTWQLCKKKCRPVRHRFVSMRSSHTRKQPSIADEMTLGYGPGGRDRRIRRFSYFNHRVGCIPCGLSGLFSRAGDSGARQGLNAGSLVSQRSARCCFLRRCASHGHAKESRPFSMNKRAPVLAPENFRHAVRCCGEDSRSGC